MLLSLPRFSVLVEDDDFFLGSDVVLRGDEDGERAGGFGRGLLRGDGGGDGDGVRAGGLGNGLLRGDGDGDGDGDGVRDGGFGSGFPRVVGDADTERLGGFGRGFPRGDGVAEVDLLDGFGSGFPVGEGDGDGAGVSLRVVERPRGVSFLEPVELLLFLLSERLRDSVFGVLERLPDLSVFDDDRLFVLF